MQQPSYRNQRFLTLKSLLAFCSLSYSLFFSTDKHIRPLTLKKKERKQGQRRITMPGPRGNIFDEMEIY